MASAIGALRHTARGRMDMTVFGLPPLILMMLALAALVKCLRKNT